MTNLRIYDPASDREQTCATEINGAAIVLCRLDSSRLPGKVLRHIQSRPLLHWVVDRVNAIDSFYRTPIVATSSRKVDDPIAEYCDFHNIECFRGSSSDVAQRTLRCAEKYELDWFARVNADSPLVDATLIDLACKVAANDHIDFVTNVSPRSFPYGVSVELVRTKRFREAYQEMWLPDHFEHVTKILYQPEQNILTHSIVNPEDLSAFRLTVDTQADWVDYCRCISASNQSPSEISFYEAVQTLQPKREAA